MTDHTSRHIEINGELPIVFAIDTTASMLTTDAPGGQSRIAYARERVREIIARLPIHTPISVWGFDADVRELANAANATQACAALGVLDANGANTNTGLVVEHFVSEAYALARATGKVATVPTRTLIIVTDGHPADEVRVTVWQRYAEHERIADMRILALGEHAADIGRELDDGLEIRLRTRTQSDKPEAERVKAPTVPPSIQPPPRSRIIASASDPLGQVRITDEAEPAKPAPKTPPAPEHKPMHTSHAHTKSSSSGRPTEHVDPRKHGPKGHK